MQLIEGGKKDVKPLGLLIGSLLILALIAGSTFAAGFGMWSGMIAAERAMEP
jgi:hypothetical protein